MLTGLTIVKNATIEKKKGESEMSEQLNLFDQEPDWSKEWQGMPEFIQEKQKPFGYLQLPVKTMR